MPKKKDNKTWFQKVSRGGKRFIDLSNPYNLQHLTKRELQYLNFQVSLKRYDLYNNTVAYRQKGITDLEKAGLRTAQQRLLKGVFYREALKNYGEAYATGLRFNGYEDLAETFEKVYGKMTYEDKYNWSTLDLPELPIFYKLKGKAEAAKNDVEPASREYAIKQVAKLILNEAVDKLSLNDYIDNSVLLKLALGITPEDLKKESLSSNKSRRELLKEKLS